MTARKRATITTDLPDRMPRSALVVGPARIVPNALRRLDCPWQWDHAKRGFLVPRQRLPDIEALLTRDGHDVQPKGSMLL